MGGRSPWPRLCSGRRSDRRASYRPSCIGGMSHCGSSVGKAKCDTFFFFFLSHAFLRWFRVFFWCFFGDFCGFLGRLPSLSNTRSSQPSNINVHGEDGATRIVVDCKKARKLANGRLKSAKSMEGQRLCSWPTRCSVLRVQIILPFKICDACGLDSRWVPQPVAWRGDQEQVVHVFRHKF